MNNFSQRANRMIRPMLDYKSLLLIYSGIDLLLTFIRVSNHFDELMASDMNPPNPLPFYVSPFLLLIACLGVKLNKNWSYLIAIVASTWLVKRILFLWADIANAYNYSLLSWETWNSWWHHEIISRWEIPRLAVAILVLITAVYLLTQSLLKKSHKPVEDRLSQH
jgi:hypothetical protein